MLRLLLLTGTCTMVAVALVRAQSADQIEQKIDALINQLTLDEKITLLGGTGFASPAIPRLAIPALTMTDGPVGVRSGRSTAFPASIALGATWNPVLAGEYGKAIAEEARAKQKYMLLGPCININRVPQGGRSFESFGEDPYLMSRLVVDYVRGVQSQGIAACTKHFATNNQEYERLTISTEISERALREIYLPAFMAAVQEGGTLGIMSAYNKLNGIYCSEDPFLLDDILKKEWGFEGMIVSDWGAVHSTVGTANAGLDIEMPHGTHLNVDSLKGPIARGEVKVSAIDAKIRRTLRVIFRIGLFEKKRVPDTSIVGGKAHRDLARTIGAQGMVLLKNDEHVLPLDASSIRTLAVIGPNAAILRSGGGGSALVEPTNAVSPLDALRAKLGSKVELLYAKGCEMPGEMITVASSALHPPGSPGTRGLKGEYFPNKTLEGEPVFTRLDETVNFDWSSEAPAPGVSKENYSVRWTGTITAPADGEYDLGVRSDDGSRLWLDSVLLIDNWSDHATETRMAHVKMAGGKPHDIQIEFYQASGASIVQLGWHNQSERLLDNAVAAAKRADAVLLFVGNSAEIESEGFDRSSIALPAGQDQLVESVLAANPKTVVVLNTGAPVLMPWIGRASAVLEAWFPGQEGGDATCDILFGRVNPSGKLPVTFPAAWEDCPAYPTYPGKDGKTHYDEGIFVGYRHFDQRGIEPLFPFGHGLSYTTFRYSQMSVKPAPRGKDYVCEVSVDVKNTGKREGTETVQIYVSDVRSSIPRPPKELKGFAKVMLRPGELQRVAIRLPRSAFTYWNPGTKEWTLEPGTFFISAGSSSRDLRETSAITLDK
jgi:beta-glucosidase